MTEMVKNPLMSACLSPFFGMITKFLGLGNTLNDFSGKNWAKKSMSAKTLLLSLLSKMRSNITYMCGHHLNNHKNAPLRVHHVDSEDSVISSAFPASCNRLFLDATFFLKQNTIYHNSVKVSDPMIPHPLGLYGLRNGSLTLLFFIMPILW